MRREAERAHGREPERSSRDDDDEARARPRGLVVRGSAQRLRRRPADGVLERSLDDVGRVGVVADVRREAAQRVVVAHELVRVVAAPVVVPVEQHLLVARDLRRSGPRVDEADRHAPALRAQHPLADELGIDVGAIDLFRRRGEVALHHHETIALGRQG